MTGTRRSGTSMWMQVLAAAGLPVIGEAFPGNWGESLRAANPHGFYESLLRHGIYWRTNPHPVTGEFVLPEQVRRHAVKIFIPGVIRTDRVYLDRVLVSVRSWREYEASLLRLHTIEDAYRARVAPGRSAPPRMPPALEWWDENFGLVRDLAIRRYACHVQAYDAVLADPARVVPRILAWLGEGGDVAAAIAAVRPEARTQRQWQGAARGHAELPEHVVAVLDDFHAAIVSGEGLERGLMARMNEVQAELAPALAEHRERVAAAAGSYREDEPEPDDGPSAVLRGEWA
ncbi:MAG: hypothetical protein IPO88_23245 [Nannocystis sp.]|uniref:hypothetical protein n=1 Tax=Nannocystis sp. TaxID=1962667 RepID=UPI002420D76A|nr:hypothetical protein [Nannocystis sp.]MBK9756359.1 hypothetical protein [Nannocystis sp.]